MATSERHSFKAMLEKGIVIDEKVVAVDKVFIPRIQRSYAQGRKSEEEIRSDFLKDIFDCLCKVIDVHKNEKESVLELSFLFGSKQPLTNGGEGFEVLDGQQRITTLFLLHWYLWMKEQAAEGKDIPAYLKQFTYETRDTSTQFINKITQASFQLQDDPPSKVIKACKWYTAVFGCDPSVSAMLNMLDAIDGKYKECGKTDLYDKLERLQFYVLFLNEFELNDELYIKMNSRGLDLTPFENFKASLIRFMKKGDHRFQDDAVLGKTTMPYYLRFSTLMDTKWNDIFWTLPQVPCTEKGVVDGIVVIDNQDKDAKFFRFIIRYLFTKLVLVYGEDGDGYKELVDFLYNKSKKEDDAQTAESDYAVKERMVGWDHFHKILEKLGYEGICSFEKVMNVMKAHYADVIHPAINGNPYTSKAKDWDFFAEYGDYILPYRVVFAAVTEFIEAIPENKAFIDPTIQDNFRKMFRVMWNVLENTKTEDRKSTISVISAMSELIQLSGSVDGDFYWSISHNTINSRNAQLDEEIRKAKMISEKKESDPNWEKAFISAEKHPLFKGMVRFFYEETIPSSIVFSDRYKIMKTLFDDTGISEAYRNDHILIRALIGKLDKWEGENGLKDKYITENAEDEGYLKILLGTKGAENLFCELFKSGKTPTDFFDEVITNARWGDGDVRIARVHKRLVNDGANGARTIALYNQMTQIENKRKKRYHIIQNGACIIICIRYNERIVLDTERHLIVKELTQNDGFDFQDEEQKNSMATPLEDAWGEKIVLKKVIPDENGKGITLTTEFDLWKKVSIYVNVTEDVTSLPDVFEPVAGRWKWKDTVDYDTASDYQKIKNMVLLIEKLLQNKTEDYSQTIPE